MRRTLMDGMSSIYSNTMLSNTHTHITRMQFHASSAACSIATPAAALRLTTKALRQVSRAASSSQKTHPVVLWCMWSGRLRHQRGEESSRAGESRSGTDGVPTTDQTVVNRLTARRSIVKRIRRAQTEARLAARRSALGRSRGPCGRTLHYTLHSLWRHCFCVSPTEQVFRSRNRYEIAHLFCAPYGIYGLLCSMARS